MPSETPVEVIPGAKRLISSLRDLGYDFSQAVADIVDNSIEARCSTVRIDVVFDGQDSWVRISDDGRGMSSQELLEALRYGADRSYGEEDLGKFGLGLKTASMSQCRRLTVASRSSTVPGGPAAYSWDLDHIEATNRWEVLPYDVDRLPVREVLAASHGTVVLWEGLDRILGMKRPDGGAAHNRCVKMCRTLEDHLTMVFHRFMDGSVGGRGLRILLNNNELRPWDPFCRAEKRTRPFQGFALTLDSGGAVGEVRFEPYVLPHRDEFSSSEEWKRAGGPAGWLQQQGLYIYRSDRMIQSGGWSGLRGVEEHLKLARVAVHFSRTLDESFRINVAKMRVRLPPEIEGQAREKLAPTMKFAEGAYRHASVRTASVSAPAEPLRAPAATAGAAARAGAGSAPEAAFGHRGVPQGERLTISEWRALTLSAAFHNERPTVERVLARLGGGEEGAS